MMFKMFKQEASCTAEVTCQLQRKVVIPLNLGGPVEQLNESEAYHTK